MPKTLRYTLISLKEMLLSGSPIVLITIALLAFTWWWLNPNPPKRVVLATGPEQSAYDTFGKRYAEALKRNGITVELVRTQGSAQNLEMLRREEVDLGFVQGGTADIGYDDEDGIVSLGSLFVEPLWLFYREDAARRLNKSATLTNLADLARWRVNVGTPGSGVPRLFNTLLEVNRVSPRDIVLSQLEQTPATVAFLDGKLDALVFASAPESLIVQMLLQTPGVKLLDFAQAEAYSRRFGYLTPVTMPQGMVDLAKNLPPRNVRLVASTTSLLARSGTHPAVLQLFAQTAVELHGGAGWFNRAREYPNVAHSELPVAPEAERALKGGLPFLQRYLPFWLANVVERMWLALGLILALALPLSRIVPPLYSFRIRSRVFRWYAELRDIEQRAESGAATPDALLEQLDAMEGKVEKVVVPLSYTDELYALRNNIHLVRKKLLRKAQPA
ncbi:MAG: ABC transporter substrate-binding protein [Hydrogenophaga sp.]|uniref:ABC transporter substrate-binding protein n=1 Tax=Hydrogenophaga crocea TaxID=2716225 RepID=A0A6G8IDJ4_9BURK|nr:MULTISPECIES: TAXI family TRAP transporter solute-binding subunit [Hydrogenophaga]MBL0942791.1 ABC transporter substrate-binding protein [Hydrogenophaga sp.]QIM51096.1 ABC transporter substrate-binding protein [Hydrogenophaga crocea]